MSASSIVAIRPDYVPHVRAERLIAAGRFTLALASLIAIYLEPSTPARFQRATYSLLLIYTIYALVMTVVAWRSPVPSARWRIASHASDLVLFSVFVYLTEGPASPFFLYFIFSLFCATLRFDWSGVLATAVAAMGVYGMMAIVASASDPDFDWGRVLIREAYLGVVAALVFYLGIYHHRLRGEMAALAAWPRELAGGIRDVLSGGLLHAASVVKARRLLLFWEEREEPWLYIASVVEGELALERVPPGTFDMPGANALRNSSAFVRADGKSTLVYTPGGSTATEITVPVDHESLQRRYGIDSAIVVSLETQSLTTHLVIPNVRSATADELALAYIVGRLLLATLEQFFYVQQVRHLAGAEERLRISRELHDGIVQSLGGVGLQLQAVRKRLNADPDVIEKLEHLQGVVEHDQRELRSLVRELRPHDSRDGRTIIAEELQRLSRRYALEWGLDVTASARTDEEVTPRLAHEVCRIVNESLANAARHGGATRTIVDIATHDGAITLRVADSGRGFPFTGRYDLAALQRAGLGPKTLQERIAALGGSLVVDSSAEGAVIEIAIPMLDEESR